VDITYCYIRSPRFFKVLSCGGQFIDGIDEWEWSTSILRSRCVTPFSTRDVKGNPSLHSLVWSLFAHSDLGFLLLLRFEIKIYALPRRGKFVSFTKPEGFWSQFQNSFDLRFPFGAISRYFAADCHRSQTRLSQAGQFWGSSILSMRRVMRDVKCGSIWPQFHDHFTGSEKLWVLWNFYNALKFCR
jgi:hypothetical protein